MEADFANDLARSHLIDYETWARRSVVERMLVIAEIVLER